MTTKKTLKKKKELILILLIVVIVGSIVMTWFAMDHYFTGNSEKVESSSETGKMVSGSGKVSITINTPEIKNNESSVSD